MSWTINKQQRRAMADAYEAGATTTDIAQRFGVSQPHVSKILRQDGVAMRAGGRRSPHDTSVAKICASCGVGFKRRAKEKPHVFVARQCCSRRCRSVYVGAKVKETKDRPPWLVGRRLLLAKTCPTCNEFLPAARFQRQDRGYYATNCARCVQRGWVAEMDDPDRRNLYDARNAAARSRNEESRDHARRHGYQWTGPELELLDRNDLSAPQVAEMLGRTIFAVHTQRRKLQRGDPMTTIVAGTSEARQRRF